MAHRWQILRNTAYFLLKSYDFCKHRQKIGVDFFEKVCYNIYEGE